MTREFIRKQCAIAEHLANDRKQPLMAFLVLYNLLLRRGQASDEAQDTTSGARGTEGEARKNASTQAEGGGSHHNPDTSAASYIPLTVHVGASGCPSLPVTDPAVSASRPVFVEHADLARPCFAAMYKRDELLVRLRAAELLLWGEHACDTSWHPHAAPCSSCGDTDGTCTGGGEGPEAIFRMRPPMGRQASLECAELAHHILTPLFSHGRFGGAGDDSSSSHGPEEFSVGTGSRPTPLRPSFRRATGAEAADATRAAHQGGYFFSASHVVSAQLVPDEAFTWTFTEAPPEDGAPEEQRVLCSFAASDELRSTMETRGGHDDREKALAPRINEEEDGDGEETAQSVPALVVIRAYVLFALAARRGPETRLALRRCLALLHHAEEWLQLAFAPHRVQQEVEGGCQSLQKRFHRFLPLPGTEARPVPAPSSQREADGERFTRRFGNTAEHNPLTKPSCSSQSSVSWRAQAQQAFRLRIHQCFVLCKALLYTELSRLYASSCLYMSRQSIGGMSTLLVSALAHGSSGRNGHTDHGMASFTSSSTPSPSVALPVAPQEMKARVRELYDSLQALTFYSSYGMELQQEAVAAMCSTKTQTTVMRQGLGAEREHEILSACASSLAFFYAQSHLFSLETGLGIPLHAREHAEHTGNGILGERDVAKSLVRHVTTSWQHLQDGSHVVAASPITPACVSKGCFLPQGEFTLLRELLLLAGLDVPTTRRPKHDSNAGDGKVPSAGPLHHHAWLAPELRMTLQHFAQLQRIVASGGRREVVATTTASDSAGGGRGSSSSSSSSNGVFRLIPFHAQVMEVEKGLARVLACLDESLLVMGSGSVMDGKSRNTTAARASAVATTSSPTSHPQGQAKQESHPLPEGKQNIKAEPGEEEPSHKEEAQARRQDHETIKRLREEEHENESSRDNQRPAHEADGRPVAQQRCRRPFHLLYASPYTQTRLLIQLKVSAFISAAAFALTNTHLLRCVRHLSTVTGFMRMFHSHFTIPRSPFSHGSRSLPSGSSSSSHHKHPSQVQIDVHLLIACLCMNLSLRDVKGAIEKHSSLSSGSTKEGSSLAPSSQPADKTDEQAVGYFDYYEGTSATGMPAAAISDVALDVGLPYYHLQAAEDMYLSSMAAFTHLNPSLALPPGQQPQQDRQHTHGPLCKSTSMSSTLLQIKLLKAVALYQVAAMGEGVVLTGHAGDGAFATMNMALSQRRRCSAAVGEVLEKLAESYADAFPAAVSVGASVTNMPEESTVNVEKGDAPTTPTARSALSSTKDMMHHPTWTHTNTALYFLLQAVYAETESKDEVSAHFYLRKYLKLSAHAVHGSAESNIFVADALQLLAGLFLRQGHPQGKRMGHEEAQDAHGTANAEVSAGEQHQDADGPSNEGKVRRSSPMNEYDTVSALARQSCGRYSGLALLRLLEDSMQDGLGGSGGGSAFMRDNNPYHVEQDGVVMTHVSGEHAEPGAHDDDDVSAVVQRKAAERRAKDMRLLSCLTEWRALQWGILAGAVRIEDAFATANAVLQQQKQQKQQQQQQSYGDEDAELHRHHASVSMRERLLVALFSLHKPNALPTPKQFLDVVTFLPHTPGYRKLEE